jgi:processive 1,2-diacylglycerol beta-glucosyltransferase
MIIIDTLKYINPVINRLVVGSYLSTLKKTPSLYGKLYNLAEDEEIIINFSEVINDILSLKLKSLIAKYDPDVILCTHPFPLEMLSILKRKGKITVPVAAVITDYAPHSFWLYDHIDAYVVPHEDFVQDLIDRGIPRSIIYPLGIPVSSDFLNNEPKSNVRKYLHIDNKPTVLIMGGGLGMGNIRKIFESLAFCHLDIQIIVCTGENKVLKEKLECISKSSNKKIIIYPYTDNISTLMSASDILVTKPGGLTVTEALVKRLPIIITSAIPGQEERNANYLLSNGIAERITDAESIVEIISQLINNPVSLSMMQENAAIKAKPDASKEINKLLEKLKN